MTDVVVEWKLDDSTLRVVFEQTSRNAYAYMIDGDEFVGDVWLYNIEPTPSEPPWTDIANAPFSNPRDFCDQEGFAQPIEPANHISGEFIVPTDTTYPTYFKLFIFSELHAVLVDGQKPGYCKLATDDGPLAKVLQSFHEHNP